MLPSSLNTAALDRTISTDDGMFVGHKRHYYWVGESALNCISAALILGERDPARIRRVLDMPCGHGRVLRWLHLAFPDAELMACDLERSGVDFCAAQFGAIPVYSEVDVDRVSLAGKFDLIWAGSLLTHLDSDRWPQFLRFWERHLNPDGILLMTTHGRKVTLAAEDEGYGIGRDESQAQLARYRESGFGYAEYENAPGYGVSMSSPQWVLDCVMANTSLRVLSFSEAAWDYHQDVCALIRNRAERPPGKY